MALSQFTHLLILRPLAIWTQLLCADSLDGMVAKVFSNLEEDFNCIFFAQPRFDSVQDAHTHTLMTLDSALFRHLPAT